MAHRLVNNGGIAAGVRYKVKPYMNAGRDSFCVLSCERDHIESKCSHHQPKCGYCAGQHRLSGNRSNVVGCASKYPAVCGHMEERCLNCKGAHVTFSRMGAKKIEAIGMARQSRRVQPNGRERREGKGASRAVLGTRQARNTRNGDGEPMADKQEGDTGEMKMEGAEVEEDVTMSETTAEIEL